MVSAKSCSNIVRLVLNNMHELVAETIIAIILFRLICLQAFLNRYGKGIDRTNYAFQKKNEIKTLVIMITNNKENE